MQRLLIYLTAAFFLFNLPGVEKVKAIGSPTIPVVPETSGDCVAPPDGIVGWWPGESNGDDIVGGNTAVLENGITFAPGEVGLAFDFTATNQALMVPENPALDVGQQGGFTVEAWIKPSAINVDYPIFEWNTGSGSWGVHFHMSPNQPFNVSPGPGELYANVVDSNGNWHQLSSNSGIVVSNTFQHVALTYDKASGVATIYCNGVVVARQNLGSFTPLTSYNLYLGRRPLTEGEDLIFSGLIDEPSVYNRALSATEIQGIYNAGSAGKCHVSITPPATNCVSSPAGIVGWWPGDSNTLDVINGDNGLPINGVSYTNGEVRQAFNFSDPTLQQCIDIPYAPALISTNYSVEAWVNPSGPVNSGIGQTLIFGQSYGHVQLVVRSGVSGVIPVFQFGTDKYTFYEVDATNEIPIGMFTHLSGTWDGITLRLYINGVLNNAVTPGAIPADSGCDFFIGGFNHPASDSCNYVGQFFTGAIDEVSFYNRALSATEIQAIYNAGSAGKCGESVSPPSTNCVAPPNGIVGWWPGEGNGNDLVSSNNGAVVNATFTNGVVGQAFSFDPENYPYGTYTGIQIPDSPAYVLTNSLTIEGWIRPRGAGYEIFWRGDNRPGFDPYYLSMQGDNELDFGISDSNNNAAFAKTTLVYGQWVYVAATLDGNTGAMTLYTNGVVADQIITNLRPMGDLIADQHPGIGIGNVNDGFNNFPFNGDIDEISLYNRALSANEITMIYNAGSAGKCTSGLITSSSSPPNIISQPGSQTVLAGSNVVFSVTATGSGSLTYQWKFNGANISGATNATLALTDLHSNQSGNYQVRVSNSFGSVTSDSALLSVTAQNLLVYNYSGSEKVTTAGQEFSYNYTGKMFFIPANTNGVFIGWASINKKKQYWISPFSDYRMINIPGAAKHVYTVLGKAGSEVDSGGQPHIWSFLHTGLNATLTIGTRRTFSFPNTFSCDDRQVYPDPQSGNMILRSAVSTYTYASSATQTANNNGSTLTDLVNAQTTSLIRQGYQQQ